mmetsp:Transcript_22739/g.49052  ORF Transcript_22739/g.49052 Transcript_22739/m.49052 type:complete len:236 (+) Transcript_22739:158-865(+)
MAGALELVALLTHCIGEIVQMCHLELEPFQLRIDGHAHELLQRACLALEHDLCMLLHGTEQSRRCRVEAVDGGSNGGGGLAAGRALHSLASGLVLRPADLLLDAALLVRALAGHAARSATSRATTALGLLASSALLARPHRRGQQRQLAEHRIRPTWPSRRCMVWLLDGQLHETAQALFGRLADVGRHLVPFVLVQPHRLDESVRVVRPPRRRVRPRLVGIERRSLHWPSGPRAA